MTPSPLQTRLDKALELIEVMRMALNDARTGLELRGAGYDEWVTCDDALSAHKEFIEENQLNKGELK